MSISQAWRLCPKAVYLQPNFPLYIKVSNEIMVIARSKKAFEIGDRIAEKNSRQFGSILSLSLCLIFSRVCDACFSKRFFAVHTGLAFATMLLAVKIAGPRQIKRHPQLDAFTD